MKKGNIFKIAVIGFVLLRFSLAQTVFEPLVSSVYDYLELMNRKGICDVNNQLKPLSRLEIAENLITIYEHKELLSTVDLKRLYFYLQEFDREINMNGDTFELPASGNVNGLLKYLDKYSGYYYDSERFKISLRPILGVEEGSIKGNAYYRRWNGFNIWGYLTENIGFEARFRDNFEKGSYFDSLKVFTPETGINKITPEENSVDYSEVSAAITYSWDWGYITARKGFTVWGNELQGNLVLSDKAPSFPYIALSLKLTSSLTFYYMHAWLASDVIDSTTVYPTDWTIDRYLYRNKYFASHSIFYTPGNGIRLSLGESIVYSDRLEPVYFIPVMFFRAADHYLSNRYNEAGGNAQFFFNLNWENILPGTGVYGTLFIDEISLGDVFDRENHRNQLGYNIGVKKIVSRTANIYYAAEYTRIYPFVYMHFIPTQTYQNGSYDMGHWIGQNSDMFYQSLTYYPRRELKITGWFRYIRKGEKGTADQQYNLDLPQPDFLFGLNNNYLKFGMEMEWEALYDMKVKLKFFRNLNEFETSESGYKKSYYNEIYLSLFYGF